MIEPINMATKPAFSARAEIIEKKLNEIVLELNKLEEKYNNLIKEEQHGSTKTN